jgi:hypothetical protein
MMLRLSFGVILGTKDDRLSPRDNWPRRGEKHMSDDAGVHGTPQGLHSVIRPGPACTCCGRWRDCPPDYGPYTTIYNRFNRWSRQGIWLGMFKALTGSTGVIGTAAIDSSHVKAHRSAAGGKGRPSRKPSDARAAAARQRSTP